MDFENIKSNKKNKKKYQICLITVFENYFIFQKINENKKHCKYMFSSCSKNRENTKKIFLKKKYNSFMSFLENYCSNVCLSFKNLL